MEEFGGLQSTGRKESDMTERLHFHFHFSLNYRVEPQLGGPLYVPDALNREVPQAREPSKCLNRQSYGERPPQKAF